MPREVPQAVSRTEVEATKNPGFLRGLRIAARQCLRDDSIKASKTGIELSLTSLMDCLECGREDLNLQALAGASTSKKIAAELIGEKVPVSAVFLVVQHRSRLVLYRRIPSQNIVVFDSFRVTNRVTDLIVTCVVMSSTAVVSTST